MDIESEGGGEGWKEGFYETRRVDNAHRAGLAGARAGVTLFYPYSTFALILHSRFIVFQRFSRQRMIFWGHYEKREKKCLVYRFGFFKYPSVKSKRHARPWISNYRIKYSRDCNHLRGLCFINNLPDRPSPSQARLMSAKKHATHATHVCHAEDGGADYDHYGRCLLLLLPDACTTRLFNFTGPGQQSLIKKLFVFLLRSLDIAKLGFRTSNSLKYP